jgi:hypothetical protein
MSIYSVKKKVHIIAIDPSVYNLQDLCIHQLPENHPLKEALVVRLRKQFWGTFKVPPLQLLSSESLTEEEVKKLTNGLKALKVINT